MSETLQFTAHNYPDDCSEIVTDATVFGYITGTFEDAVSSLGNDVSLSWPSYSEENVSFNVRYDGQGEVLQEGMTWPVWLLTLNRGEDTKILKIDIATCSTKLWTDEGFIDGGFLGNSDLIAAVMNLQRFVRERKEEGNTTEAAYRRFMRMMFDSEAKTE